MKVFRFRFRNDFVFKPEFLNPHYMTFWHHPFFSHPSFRFQVRLYFFRSQFRIVKFFSAPNLTLFFIFSPSFDYLVKIELIDLLNGCFFVSSSILTAPRRLFDFLSIFVLVVLLHLNFYFNLFRYSVLINPIFRRITVVYLKYSTINCLINRIFV